MKIQLFFLVLLSLLLVAPVNGQKTNKKLVVSGTVTDPSKQPVVEAMIIIDGKNTDVLTNDKGIYKVKVRPDADTLTIFSFNNGMKSESLKGKTIIDFTLSGSSGSLQNLPVKAEEDNTVDIGYGRVKQRDLVTPVNNINTRNNRYATYKNIYEILKETPGVTVNGTSVRIQGPSSLSLSSEPLYIVDGQSTYSIENISPLQVESISVLKGASASIYGSRGANGVVIVNLIKGPKIK
jgi:TonB-dependent SusC/RagA subfamily outer membrane receptor